MLCLSAFARLAGHSSSPASSLLHFDQDSNIVADLNISSSSPVQSDTFIDVEICNPIAPSSFDIHNRPKSVALEAERAKITKHGRPVSAAMRCNFVPFIMERFGAFAPQARSLFNRLSHEIDPDSFFPVNWAARTSPAYWQQRLSISLWGGHAQEIHDLWLRSCNRLYI